MDEADFNSHCCSLQDTNGGAPTAGKIKAGREEQPVPTGQKEFGHAPLGGSSRDFGGRKSCAAVSQEMEH